jgi:hydrogenase maturation protein HypF
MAVSYLLHNFGSDFQKLELPFLRRVDPKKTALVVQMMEKGVHSPLTSSCGRLFDAVAALLKIRNTVSYEGQAAIQLEHTIRGTLPSGAYSLELVREGNTSIIQTRPLFEAIVRDLRQNVPVGVIARRFHDGLISIFVTIAKQIRDTQALDRVCLSGGTFQNLYLSENLQQQLECAGFHVFTQSEVPCNDGGLSLGQALIAAHQDVPK